MIILHYFFLSLPIPLRLPQHNIGMERLVFFIIVHSHFAVILPDGFLNAFNSEAWQCLEQKGLTVFNKKM